MPFCETKYFGRVEHSQEDRIFTPAGLPGFDNEREFLLLQFPEQYPLVYIQSVQTPDLCFVALPILTVDEDYRLNLSEGDSEVLGVGRRPRFGSDVLCLALIAVRESGPTANLLAPLVISIRSRVAVQCINAESDYSHQHALAAAEGVAA